MSALVDGTERRAGVLPCGHEPRSLRVDRYCIECRAPEPGSAASPGDEERDPLTGQLVSARVGAEPGSAVAPQRGGISLKHCGRPGPEGRKMCLGNCTLHPEPAGAVASEAPRVDLEADRRLPLTPRERREWESARQTWIEIADLRYRQGIEKGLQRAAELCGELYANAKSGSAAEALCSDCEDAILDELSDLLRDAEELDTGVIDHCVKLALELEAALEESREAVAKLAGIRVNMQSSIDQLSDQLTDSEAEVARLTGERDVLEAERDGYRANLCDLVAAFSGRVVSPGCENVLARARSILRHGTRAAPPGEPAR